MFCISVLKSSSLRMGSFGIVIRPKWFVTPCGRMASNSGWTHVFVEGAITPNLRRKPRESKAYFLLLRAAVRGKRLSYFRLLKRAVIQPLDNGLAVHEIGILAAHIKEVRLMRPQRAIADAVGRDHSGQLMAHRVDDTCPNAAARRAAGDDKCIDLPGDEPSRQFGREEGGWLPLANN